MKLSRVSRKLPVGVVVHTDVQEMAKLFDGLFRTGTTKQLKIESNTPLTLTLEVPDGQDKTVAAVLREMADELEGAHK